MKLMTCIKTILIYCGVLIIGIVVGLPCLIIASLPVRLRRDNSIYYFFVNIFYQAITRITFLPITIIGRENIIQEPAIFASNHLSALDIPFVGSLVGYRSHFWMFIKKYAHVPLFGFIARRMNVVVDTTNPRTMMVSLKEALRRGSKKKRSIVIFPEGGRSLNGDIQELQRGCAVLAAQTGLPVIPIRIYNLDKAFPIGAFYIRPFPITIIIGKPMYMHPTESREEFVQRLHAWMENPSIS